MTNAARGKRIAILSADWSGLKALFAALLVLVALSSGAGAPRPARAAGAVGIVVRHGDGRILYASVPLTSDHLTGAEALQMSGLALNVSAGGAYGTAVCAIDGEGCQAPKENCFCKSYGDPSFYWHYYVRNADGTWSSASVGAGNRTLHDGDADGWSWTSGESNLPTVTPAQIAAAVQSPPPPPATTDTASAAPTPAASVVSATTVSQPRVVAIAPNGSATPINAAAKPSSAPTARTIVGFVAVVAVMLALLALVPRWRK